MLLNGIIKKVSIINKSIVQNKQEKQTRDVTIQKNDVVETAVSNPQIPVLQRAFADPNDITPNDAKTLQRTFGNQAVHRAVQRAVIQRKMTLGPVGDKYEQKADAVAKQVVQTINTPKAPPVQRQEAGDELQMKPFPSAIPLPPISTLQRQQEEDALQLKPSRLKPFQSNLPPFPFLQRQEDEEELQAKGDSMLAGGELSGDLENSVQQAKSGGQPLGDGVRGSMEQAFNADFSSVKVHTDSQSDTLNRSISARAFTTGQDIFFRGGEYNPASSAGKTLIAHELTHTIQQGVVTNIGQRKSETNTRDHTGMPDRLKTGIENLSGMSLDDVKVHRNSDKPAQFKAHAYAQGADIHLGPGQEKHLPHEAWHVVQQKQGRVKPTMQMKEMDVNHDIGLEREADVMGKKALQLKTEGSFNTLQKNPSTSGQGHTAQMFWPEAIALLVSLGVVGAGIAYLRGGSDTGNTKPAAADTAEKQQIEGFLQDMNLRKNELTKKGKKAINYVSDLLARKDIQTAVNYINEDRPANTFFRPPSNTPLSTEDSTSEPSSESSEKPTFAVYSSKLEPVTTAPNLGKAKGQNYSYHVNAIPGCKLRRTPMEGKSSYQVDTSNPSSTGSEPLIVVYGSALIDGHYVAGEIHGHMDIKKIGGAGQQKQYTHFSRVHFKLPDGSHEFITRDTPLGSLTVGTDLPFQWKSTKFWAPKMQSANVAFNNRAKKRAGVL